MSKVDEPVSESYCPSSEFGDIPGTEKSQQSSLRLDCLGQEWQTIGTSCALAGTSDQVSSVLSS
jgi:hypothetical protein